MSNFNVYETRHTSITPTKSKRSSIRPPRFEPKLTYVNNQVFFIDFKHKVTNIGQEASTQNSQKEVDFATIITVIFFISIILLISTVLCSCDETLETPFMELVLINSTPHLDTTLRSVVGKLLT